MFDAIGQIFQGVIDFLTPIVLPEWKALVDLFPVFLLIGVVGPLLSLLILGWVIYFIGKPRSRIFIRQIRCASRSRCSCFSLSSTSSRVARRITF